MIRSISGMPMGKRAVPSTTVWPGSPIKWLRRIPDSEFRALRNEVLTQWPTGKDVNLEEAVAYHKAMPENRIFGQKLLKAKATKTTLVQPRAGVPVVERHIELLQHLQNFGEADLLPIFIKREQV